MNARPQIQRSSVEQKPDWARLYRVGGFAAFVYVALVLIPVVLVFAAPVPPSEGEPLLEYVLAHKLVYFIELICFVGLSVPALAVFAALAMRLRSVDGSIAALGGLAGIVSETIALALGSSPQSLHGGIVVLASQYAKTTDGSRRAALASAADALIAATNAVAWAGILTASAILLLSLLLRPAGMGAKLGTLGVITGALGIASEALRPIIGPGYILYGMLLPLWFALIGRKLLQRNA
ncbi:MAG: hypothetical protein ACYC3W_01200 [Candidatus Nanopelagicales bacterium]